MSVPPSIQVVSALPDDIRPGPDLYGVPWEPVIISGLVGLISLLLFTCRCYSSVSVHTSTSQIFNVSTTDTISGGTDQFKQQLMHFKLVHVLTNYVFIVCFLQVKSRLYRSKSSVPQTICFITRLICFLATTKQGESVSIRLCFLTVFRQRAVDG